MPRLLVLTFGIVIVLFIITSGAFIWWNKYRFFTTQNNQSAVKLSSVENLNSLLREAGFYSAHNSALRVHFGATFPPKGELPIWQNLRKDTGDTLSFGCNWTKANFSGKLWTLKIFVNPVEYSTYLSPDDQVSQLNFNTALCFITAIASDPNEQEAWVKQLETMYLGENKSQYFITFK